MSNSHQPNVFAETLERVRAAALAATHRIEMSSHLYSEVSAHLLAATPTCHFLEYMDWADKILAEPLEIVAAAQNILRRGGALAGKRVIVTSGPTHEPIDPVRYIANRSSGKQGHAIAAAAAAAGAEVVLVNAHHVKQVPGRKTDVKDAEWLATLLRVGLLRGGERRQHHKAGGGKIVGKQSHKHPPAKGLARRASPRPRWRTSRLKSHPRQLLRRGRAAAGSNEVLVRQSNGGTAALRRMRPVLPSLRAKRSNPLPAETAP